MNSGRLPLRHPASPRSGHAAHFRLRLAAMRRLPAWMTAITGTVRFAFLQVAASLGCALLLPLFGVLMLAAMLLQRLGAGLREDGVSHTTPITAQDCRRTVTLTH